MKSDKEESMKPTNVSLMELEKSLDQNKIELKEACSSTKSTQRNSILSRYNIQPLPLTEFNREVLEASQEPLRRDSTIYSTCDDSESDIDEPNSSALNVIVEDEAVAISNTPSELEITISENDKSIVTKSESAKFVIPSLPIPKKPQPVHHLSKYTPEHFFVPTEGSYENEDQSDQVVDVKDIIQNHSMLPEPFMSIEENHENAKNNNENVQYSSPSNPVFERIEVNRVSYIILNRLGQGGSSMVYHCYDVKTKSDRAIKEVDISDSMCSVSYINEVKLLKKLQRCNRIIKMYDYEIIESKKKLLVVLERGNSDLSKILKKISSTNEHLPIHVLIYYWMEMLYAVQQIHENGIVHNDLKPANFLEVDNRLKLIDFGIATPIPENMTSAIKNVQMGSFNYISPEALINQQTETSLDVSMRQQKPKYKISYKSDVWSLGCILYQLVYRRAPFQHYSGVVLKLSVIMDSNHKIEYPEIDWIPKRIINTLKSCLQFDKNLRPSVQELIRDYENMFYC